MRKGGAKAQSRQFNFLTEFLMINSGDILLFSPYSSLLIKDKAAFAASIPISIIGKLIVVSAGLICWL